MTSDNPTAIDKLNPAGLSKRGARRVIQRAFVLVGRERAVRQHSRELELNTHWTVEDWGLEWTVVLDHGRVEFHRGHVGKAQINYLWQTGEGFLAQIESGIPHKNQFQYVGDPVWRRMADPVFIAFLATLKAVLADPVDDDGVRLL